jgi:hypothetical protein
MPRNFLRVTDPMISTGSFHVEKFSESNSSHYQWLLGLRPLRNFFRVTHPSSEFVIDPASFVRGQAAMKPRALCFR